MTRGRYFLLTLLFLFAAAIYLFFSAGYFLASPASAPQKADAIVVLGGDIGCWRSTLAVELLKEKYAPNVLIINPCSDQERQEFMNVGARRENIFFETVSKNSFEEAQNSLRTMQARGWKYVIIVTNPPHIRRVNWSWGHVLNGSGLGYAIVATSPPWWNAKNWWKNETSRDFVLSEYMKLAYYIVVYGMGL
ncbi:MAG: YdcF family protein [Dissulfurispiraceae bacterium]